MLLAQFCYPKITAVILLDSVAPPSPRISGGSRKLALWTQILTLGDRRWKNLTKLIDRCFFCKPLKNKCPFVCFWLSFGTQKSLL